MIAETSGGGSEKAARKLVAAFVQFHKIRPDLMGGPGCEMGRHLRRSEILILFGVKEIEDRHPDGVSISDLSNSLRLKAPTLTPAIYNLEREGLVERSVDRNDRRVARLRLTEEGNRFMQHIARRFIGHIRGLVNYLGEEKSDTLADLLNEVYLFVSNRSSKPS